MFHTEPCSRGDPAIRCGLHSRTKDQVSTECLLLFPLYINYSM